MRSFNRAMPEEINRIVADQLSDILFASTDSAAVNLEREGVSADKVHRVGDVMFDAALTFSKVAAEKGDMLAKHGVQPRRFVLATIHRAENTDDPKRLGNIVTALEQVAEELPVILPLHPRTAGRMKSAGLEFKKVKTIPPIGYLEMVALESQAALIATDSGGVQKEAFFYGVPCVTLRDETEWVELVDLGWNRLVSPASNGLAGSILEAVGTKGRAGAPYGDGNAARTIAKIMTA